MQKASQAKKISWQVRPADSVLVVELSHSAGVSPTLARLFINRGIIDASAVKEFLNSSTDQIHDPALFKDMDKAVARVIQAMTAGEKICVYGDYDVDGAVGTTLLVTFFKELGYPVVYYIPNRLTEGYSLNNTAISQLKDAGVKLIITVDNGIMAQSEVKHASMIGVDVVITDHHQTGDILPGAVAVVNPQRKDCTYPFKGICGAGVAYKLMLAVRRELRGQNYFSSRPEPNLKNHLDLLCIPTVCDVVPLVDENRYFVKEGLKRLKHTQRAGLKALSRVCGLEGRNIGASDLGFKFGPRINACGRLMDAMLGVRLLLCEDHDEALKLALELDRLNMERRAIEALMAASASAKLAGMDLDDVLGVAVYDPGWHIGVAGIVASRLTEKLSRPVFVLADADNGKIKGSGRSVPGVNLVEALRDCAGNWEACGGHEAAAGVTLMREQLPGFITAFDTAVKKRMPRAMLTRPVMVDDVLSPALISDDLAHEIATLEPFGMGNARPLFVAEGFAVNSKRVVGEKHLKLTLKAKDRLVDAIAFNRAEHFAQLEASVGILFGVEMNEFNNRRQLQLVVRDFLPANSDKIPVDRR